MTIMVTDVNEAPKITGLDEAWSTPRTGRVPVATYTAVDPEGTDRQVVAGRDWTGDDAG